MTMRLEIDDVSFGYDSRPVLEDVSLSVDEGELLGLLGPNGSGKTTLLQTMNRILEPEQGVVSLDGRPVEDHASEELARKVGYVPQRGNETFPTTVFETIMLGRNPHVGWRPGTRDREIVRNAIEALGLESLAMRDFHELSGGQQQKVLLGRALVQASEVLLLDEPTSGLDLKHQLEVMDLLFKYVRDNRLTAVVAIHDLNLAARYCDRFVLLQDGSIYAAGGSEILRPEVIEEVYGVTVEVRDHDRAPIIVPLEPTESEAGDFEGLLDQ